MLSKLHCHQRALGQAVLNAISAAPHKTQVPDGSARRTVAARQSRVCLTWRWPLLFAFLTGNLASEPIQHRFIKEPHHRRSIFGTAGPCRRDKSALPLRQVCSSARSAQLYSTFQPIVWWCRGASDRRGAQTHNFGHRKARRARHVSGNLCPSSLYWI